LVFNYDKATGKVGSNKNNLENALTEVKDFFLKKQDIEKPYTLSKDEYSFFERMKKELSDSQLNGSAEDSKDAMLQLAEEITGADSSLVKYIQDTDVASVSQVGFAQSQKTVIQGTTKFSAVMKTAGGVAKSFVATLGSMAVAAAAAWAIGKVIEGIDYLYHYDENIIKAGQEAKDSIDSTFKSFEEGKQSIMDLGSSFGNQTEQIKNTGDAIDQVAEKYVELRKGVNQNTNENVSLSTDEYQQYIDLSSKLASQFPGLVAGYDSQGNAVLNLASNADKAADSIRNLYEAQVSSANVDMGKNLQATYDGVVTQTSQYAEDIQKKRDELEQLDTDISENKRSILTYGSNNFEVQGLYGDKENVITDVLKENGLYKENTGDDGSIWNFYAEGLADKSKKEIDRMNEQITAGLESYNLSLETQRSQLQSEINSYDLMIEDQWRSMAQSLGNYLQTSKSFNELDDSLQSAFLANISNLDLTALNDPDGKYQGQVLDFLYGEFIGPMSRFSADVQESLADALQIDPSKLTIDEYKSQVDEAFNKAFPKEEDADKRDRFKNAYGIDSSIEDMEDNASRLKEAYADFPNASDFIDHMQTGDLSIAAQLIDNGSVDIEKGTDGLVSAIERYKKTVAEAKSDTTLASVLGDSDNEISSSIDSLQSDISSLSDTLTKLKTGEFKDSDLTDLIQQFPQLADQTDNLQEAISNLQADKLKSTLKKIDDSMDGASDEELANAQKLKDSLIKSVDLSDINSDKITESIKSAFEGDGGSRYIAAEHGAKAAEEYNQAFSKELKNSAGREAFYKATLNQDAVKQGPDAIRELYNQYLKTAKDIIQDTDIQSQLTNYQDKYQSLYQAQKDLKNGLMTGSTKKTFLDKFPDLAKYAGNTETLSSAIDDLMDSMDSDVTNQFTDAIKALQDAGQYADASALQSYVEAVLDGAHDIEGAYQKIAGLKIPTPKYAELKEALESSNEGDLYNELLSQYKTAKEAWEKGEVGTDDFKSFASIISPTGVSDAVNFGENQAMFERYFQDTSTGVENFLEDLQKLDLASNESGHWTSTLGNNLDEMRDAAQRLNMGFEPFMMMFGRLEDYGATTDFFTTEEDGQQHLSDLYQQIAEKKQKLAEIKADPDLAGDQSAIDSLNKDLDELYARVENTKTGIEELPDKATYYEAKNLEQAKSVITQMQDEINQAAAEGNDELVKILEKTRDQYLKENGYILKEQPQGPTQQGTIENPLAREFTNPTKFGDYETVIKKIQNATDEQTSSLEKNLKVLSQYSESQLSGINLSDGQYDTGFEDAEQALDNLSSTFGLTKDQAVQLAAVLSDMGLIKATPKVDLTTVQDQIDNAKDELQDSNITVDLDFDISTSSKEELQKKSQEIQNELNNNASLSDSQRTSLQGVKDSVDNQVVTLTVQEKVEKDGDVDELLAMDDQTLATTLDLDVNNADQLSTARDELQYIKDNQDAQIDMTVKLDETQFNQLLGDGENASIDVTANNEEAKEKIDEAKNYAESQKPQMKIDGNNDPAINKGTSATQMINNMTGIIKVNADTSGMASAINSELSKPHTINISANVSTHVSGGTGKSTGTMISVAHADGTAYNVINYTPAHASGNVTLSHDETALVNEEGIGAESIVRDGKWMIIPGGAHFENLKKGDLIFNKKQTSELINSGHVTSGGGHARAYANGTVGAYAGGNSGVYLNWDKNRTQVGNQSTSSPSNSTITDKNTTSVKKNTDTVNDNTEKIKKSTKVYDWVETRIKHWSDQVQKIADKITDYIKKSLKTSLLKQQIRKMNYEIGSNEKGAKAYMKKANSIANEYTYYNSDGEEIKTNVPKKYQKLVQTGAYRIEDMDTSTDQGKALAEAIDQYKTYYDKAQDCKQAVVDLKKEQLELFEQWANMPTEKAEQKLERLQNGFNGLNATQSRLSAVQTGGSTQKAIADAATASYESAQVVTEKAQSNLDTATAKADKATTAVNRKKKALLKSKGLTNEQKKAIKSGKTIDTSKITNKTTKKRAEEYNSAVKNKKKADSKKKTAQTKFNTANKNSSSLKTDAETAIAGYQEGNELSYMDSLTDQNVTQTKQAADINNKAWEETKKNLNAQEKAKKQADDKVSKKAKAIKKKFGSKLSDNQKKKLAAGKEINVDKIKDKSLKKALTAYNKYVTTAAETEQKLNIVTDAESTAAANAAESQTEAAKATVEAIQSKFDNAKTYYEGLLGYQEKYNEMEEANIDLYNAHGNYERSSDYEIKISNTESLRNIAQDKVDELEKRFQEGVDNGTIVEGSQEWINMKSEIVEAKKAVTDYDTSIENLKQQQIGVYYEEQFDRAIEKIDQFKDRIDILNEIISDDMKVDKNTGLLTELGATSVMLNRNQFSANQKEIQKLLEKENDVKKRYANGEDMSSEFGEKTYDEYIKDIQSKYNSLISSNSSLQNDMLSLVKNQAQAELDALNKVISKRKEALSAKKDYYDYDKTLKDKTKDIQILERQAAALQGSTNAEDKARLAKIQEQLSDAREDLSDTMTDHAFSMQSDALDKLSSDMSDDFDKWSNDISSNVEKMSKAINEAVSNSALSNAQVLNNLSTILKNVGLTDEQVNSTLSGLTGYASGTDYVPKSGMYRVNENGMESVLSRKYGTLTFLNQGDKVFTADFTKRLIDNAGIATQSSQPQFGEMYKELMNAITNTNNQSYEHSTVYNIVVNEATDANAVGDIVVKKIDAYEKKRVRDFKSLR
jgi:chromosome segregation ATPase